MRPSTSGRPIDDGYYDVQRPELQIGAAARALPHRAEGRFSFRSIMPAFYPIPDDGPVGEMLGASAGIPTGRRISIS